MRSVININITKNVKKHLETTPTAMAQATESAIAQISIAARFMLNWQCDNNEEQEVSVDLGGGSIVEKGCVSEIIGLEEMHEG